MKEIAEKVYPLEMTYTSAYGLGPGKTPYAIKFLIYATCFATLITGLLNPLFSLYLGTFGPSYLFSLSWFGLKSGYLFQPLTYLFIDDSLAGLSLSVLITLFFQMYILWVMGSALEERVGGYSFTKFYLLSGIVSGLVTILSVSSLGLYPLLAGPSGAIISLWIVWTMIHPQAELLFFFVLPIKAKWALAIVLSALLLVSLSQGDISSLIFYLSASLFGYLYGILAWELEGPFDWMHGVDQALDQIKARLFKSNSDSAIANDAKIIDIHTGKPFLDDETFVDEMLNKISQKGESSLTWSEKRRLKKISEKNYQKK